MRIYLKKINERTGGVSPMVECLPNKHEALGSLVLPIKNKTLLTHKLSNHNNEQTKEKEKTEYSNQLEENRQNDRSSSSCMNNNLECKVVCDLQLKPTDRLDRLPTTKPTKWYLQETHLTHKAQTD
jgi:hypothetical protein